MVAVSEGKAQFFPLDKSAIVTEIVDLSTKISLPHLARRQRLR